MRRAATGEVRHSRATVSAGKAGPAEAESLHSATKLSASKCLSARRRNSSARTPGVRKKLELSSESFLKRHKAPFPLLVVVLDFRKYKNRKLEPDN